MTDSPNKPAAADTEAQDEPVVLSVPLSRHQRILRAVARPRARLAQARFSVPWSGLMFIAVALPIAALAVMIALLNSPLLDIKTVKVEGADVVSAATVKQLVGLKDQHVMLADLEAARQRVATLPVVKEVTVVRDWPNGIKVVIVERTPWGRWRANNTVWAIDSEGVILEGLAPSSDGPIVTQVSALPAIQAGVVVDTKAVDMAAELHRRGAPLPLPGILAYEWSLGDGLVVVTEHGRIIFGDANGFDYKYAVWDLLEHEAQRRGEPLLLADLRFGLRPRVEIGLNVGRGVRIHDYTAASVSE
ncbi:MAG: FtsQ-type POTRA domain-containing protein [Chloroflexota bacterium]|nr:FtsQ-type POTRA domain-containing protein [Chloroflexota bacterium]